MDLDEHVMNSLQRHPGSSASPPSPEGPGGTSETRKGLVTGRDVTIGLGAVVLVLSVAGYLDGRLNEIQTIVHENARDLAVVQTEIKALRRDIERVEDLAKNAEQSAEAQTTSGTRTIRRRGARSPI